MASPNINSNAPTPESLPPFPLGEFPQDLAYLQALPPDSRDARTKLREINDVAKDLGFSCLALEDIYPQENRQETEGTPIFIPEGFKKAEKLPLLVHLPVSQFEGTVYSLSKPLPKNHFKVEVSQYETDMGNAIRVCDLRPFMSNSVQKLGPTGKDEAMRLDRAFSRDLKILADTGQFPNVVTGAKGTIGYVKPGKNLLRAYYMPVDDPACNEIKTVARLADSRTIPQQCSIYSSVFHMDLKKGV